jgi:hypothetical protein
MSEPIVFISHFRIKEGKLDAYKQLQRDTAELLHAQKPRTLVFLTYLNGNGAEMTAVHVFADAESMDLHFQGAEGRSIAAYEVLVPAGWEIYGQPSDDVVQTMRRAAESSHIALTMQNEHVAGFVRFSSG